MLAFGRQPDSGFINPILGALLIPTRGFTHRTEIPVFRAHHPPWENPSYLWPGEDCVRVYNVELVRQLCGEIAAEKDPQKAQDLLSLLQAVIREDHEETRTRTAFLAKKYANAVSDTNAAD